MKQILNILEVWFYELKEVFKDPGELLFIIFVPLAYPLLYSYVYTNEVVRDVPCAVVDDSHCLTSRELIRKIDATPDAKVMAMCSNMEEAKTLLKKREVYGILHIPSSFSKDINNGDQTTIGLYCDMSSMLYYKALLLATNNVSLDVNKDIKVSRHISSITSRQDEVNRTPIEYEYVPLFNTQSGFAAFLIPPVLMLIIQQTLILGIGMSLGRTREKYSSTYRYINKLYRNPINVVIGKSIFYFMIYMIMAIYMFVFVSKWFLLPQVGDYYTFLKFIVPYLFACIFFAIVMSSLVYRREDCIMLFVALSVPLLFLSGMTWPVSAMPSFWKYVSYIFPSTFGLNGYVRVASMGASLDDISFECRGLWIQAGIYFLIACGMYWWRIRTLKRRFS